MPRSVALETLTFGESSTLALKLAHWSDILSAADKLAEGIKAKGIAEKTVSAQARKVGQLFPLEVAAFRFAIVSYSLSGRRTNATQLAELASKLPSLRKVGQLAKDSIGFGSIALPPMLGEF